MDIVMSTYPVQSYQRYTELDLSEDAKKYNKLRSTSANTV